MNNSDKRPGMATCYHMKSGNNMNDRSCAFLQVKNTESSGQSICYDDKVFEQKQKESEEELENAKRTLRNTENVVRQARNGVRGCAQSIMKKPVKPSITAPSTPCKSNIGNREAIKKLSKVPATKEWECPEGKSKEKGKSNVQDISSVMQKIALICKPGSVGADVKELKELPKKPELTSEEIKELIKEETSDVESAWIITAENREIYKKPCPKQQKARDAIMALVEPKKEELLPCVPPPIIKEPLPPLDTDPEDISPEVAASIMYTQERGIKMISCPEDTIKHLFPEQFGPIEEKETEKKKGGGEVEAAEGTEAVANVAVDEVDDSVYTRNMSQHREPGDDDRASSKYYDASSKTFVNKGEFLLQEKTSKCTNRVQLRGNFAPWFPGYFIAFPDHAVDNTIQLAKSPSGVFRKAWMAAKPSNVQPADVYLVE